MFLDVPQLFSDVPQMFSDVAKMFSDVFKYSQVVTDIPQTFSDVFKMCSDVLRCSDVQKCFQVFTDVLGCSLDVLQMFSRCSQDFPQRFKDVLMTSDPIVFSNENVVFGDSKELDDPQVSDGLKVISNESMDFNDPKEFHDPLVSDDPKGISIGL